MNYISLNRIILGYSIIVFLMLITSCQSTSNKNESFSPSHTKGIDLVERADGYFDTPVDIKYLGPDGKVWKAPAGTITDGASIPNVFTRFFGGKLSEKHLFAAIVHDAYCAEANKGNPPFQTESWEDTHHMFYYACISNGRSITKASTMYAAVRLGGPRWSFNGEPFTDLSSVDEELLLEEMTLCENWIKSEGSTLTLEEIDVWMEEREQFLLKGENDYKLSSTGE